jgi:hypothetical protein
MTDEMNHWDLAAEVAALFLMAICVGLATSGVVNLVLPAIDKAAPLYHLAQGVWP